MNKGVLTSNRTFAGDEVYTPFYAVDPLLEFIPKNKKIWCPFDEEWSAYVQTFKEKGYEVTYSHLNYNQDFFQYEPDSWDILVSNPPYSQKDEVLKRAFSFDKPFALLLPLSTLQGKTRFEIFNNRIQLLGFDSRVNFLQGGEKNSPFAVGYLCRDILPTKLELRKLVKYERSLL